ncbi:MAG TPA: cytochrome c3 family protein [Anaerolineales bacterium]|nr:cytochrome c3 family protein [Anaerolineales bacterium]
MFNPGPLTAQAQSNELRGGVASHAEIKACNTCHQPLKTQQAVLCLDCHTEIQTQLDNASGLHAKLDPNTPCFACHSDHRGRDFDPIEAGLKNFDHDITSFSLLWHQVDYNAAPLACESCHTGDDFRVNQQACSDCHAANDSTFMSQHTQDYGNDCLACHDGFDRMTDFDHGTTDFPLEGQHADALCIACHTDRQFTELPTACATCHEEPAIHAGLFESTCESCHTAEGWAPATLGEGAFDHNTQTRFSLVKHQADYSGNLMNCADCHETNLETVDLNVCTTCHAQADAVFMSTHTQQFGTDCLACHDGVDRMHDFDHANFFVLDGRHAEIECVACHAEQFAGTPAECVACHAEPSIHAGVFGLQCENCHSTTAWTPASLKVHSFPLDHGGEGIIACETCHTTTYVQYTCDACHDPAEMIQKHNEEGISDISNCVECHPTGTEDEAESGGD